MPSSSLQKILVFLVSVVLLVAAYLTITQVSQSLSAKRDGGRDGGDEKFLATKAVRLGVSEERLRLALTQTKKERGSRAGPNKSKEVGKQAFTTTLARTLEREPVQVAAALREARGASKNHQQQPRLQRKDGSGADKRSKSFVRILASRLNVDAARVRLALLQARQQERPQGAKRRVQFAAQLAQELGVEQNKVEAVLRDFKQPKLRLDALATDLGVEKSALRVALQKLRAQRKVKRQAEYVAFTQELARKLGVSAEAVQAEFSFQRAKRGGQERQHKRGADAGKLNKTRGAWRRGAPDSLPQQARPDRRGSQEKRIAPER